MTGRPPAVPVHVTRLPDADPAVALPAYQTAGAAGMDVRANLPPDQRATGVSLPAGGRLAVPTGLAIALPDGFEMQIRPRSGLARQHGVTLANAPGTIDADYRGEVQVLLLNTGGAPFTVEHGMRIAQMVLAPVVRAEWLDAQTLPDSPRGRGGFGSTGL